jgi:hypothetical protein
MEPAIFQYVAHCLLSGSKAARIWSKPPYTPDIKNMYRYNTMSNTCDTRQDHVINLIDQVHWDRLFFDYFRFQMSLWFHQCSVLICIHKLLLREGQIGEAWEPFKQQCSYGKWRTLERKYFPLLRFWSFNVQFRSVNWRLRMQKMNNKITFSWKRNHNSTRQKKDTCMCSWWTYLKYIDLLLLLL